MSHHNLQDLQECFQAHVLSGSADMLAHITPDARPGPAARLAIYSDGYRLRLLEALATDFPALHTLAGDELFDRLGRAYIDTHPSRHFSLRYYGHRLSDFLTLTPLFRDTPALGEMAALEWKLTLAFDAADDPVLDASVFAKLPPESWPGMRLRFHGSVQRHDFRWNVPELWTAIDRQRDPEAPVEYSPPRAWLIWRHELQNYFRPLDADEAFALDSLRHGASFGVVCEQLGKRIDVAQIALRAAGYLKSWAGAGLIAEVLRDRAAPLTPRERSP